MSSEKNVFDCSYLQCVVNSSVFFFFFEHHVCYTKTITSYLGTIVMKNFLIFNIIPSHLEAYLSFLPSQAE